jgi:hypothetical protein
MKRERVKTTMEITKERNGKINQMSSLVHINSQRGRRMPRELMLPTYIALGFTLGVNVTSKWNLVYSVDKNDASSRTVHKGKFM